MIRLLANYSLLILVAGAALVGCGRERVATNGRSAANVQVTPTPNPYAYSPTPTPTAMPTPTPTPVVVNFSLPSLPTLPGTTFAPILSASSTAYAGQVNADWCKTWGDPLTAAQALQRLAWAKKSYGEWNQWYMIADSVATKLYPSFGRVNEQNKPYNPLNYKAPVVENGPRNLPEGYMLVALCAPTL